MTLKCSILVALLCFLGVFLALPFVCKHLEAIKEERISIRYTTHIDGFAYTLSLSDFSTTLTVLTNHGEPQSIEIEQVPYPQTILVLQEREQ